MTGFLATFAIAAAGTALGLIIARFSSNAPDDTTKSVRELEEQQRKVLGALDELREMHQRSEAEKQPSPQQTSVHF